VHSIVVAGTHSGVGKTTVAVGLIAALRRRGLDVQPFKVGPDFIDPAHHGAAAGRASHNLDGWILTRDANLELFAAHAGGADVAVVEGVMGLFDGSDPRDESGSAAEMAKWLGAPVLLVIDASALARSAAALVHGYATFDGHLHVAGVVANRVGGEGHAELLAEALSGGPPLVGWLPDDPGVAIPERHLGLHMPGAETAARIERAAEHVERSFDLEALLELSEREPPRAPAAAAPPAAARARIGIARDDAFCFYYEDNLAHLEAAGAELVEFSPLRDELPGRLDGLYIGGGYPELHAERLAGAGRARAGIRALAAAGRPVYGECGGLIYLGEAIEIDGREHRLCGVLPVRTRFPGRLELAYAEVTTAGGPFGPGHTARGHRFHNAELEPVGESVERCYEVSLARGPAMREGYTAGSVLGSWVHLHFRSSPELAEAFVSAAARH
jgi:cobyrinic acid a,c-diamide synthase